MSLKKWQISITIVFLVMGFLFSVQFQTQKSLINDLEMQKTEDLILMVKNLSEKRIKLESEVSELRLQEAEMAMNNSNQQALYDSIKSQLNKLAIVNGQVQVKGPGIAITITEDSPVLYIDLINIVNELWAAGAEGISINDHRVIATTKIFYSEDRNNMFITVDNTPLLFPIVIKAIGEPDTLEKGLTMPGGIADNLALFKTYLSIRKEQKIELPPAAYTPSLRYLENASQ